ncbi:MAG TPA: nicotinate phosphoribosyltransferase [Gemmataceae bacterium]|nr:nicotinate phosphoribosyltransferase [Gemmataceae bacterium]
MSQFLISDDRHLGLMTDVYELTMAAGYHVCGMADQRATFELWVRRLPSCRNYLVAAGLEQAVHYLRHLSFAPEQIAYLREHPSFRHVPNDWFERLASFRFQCDVWAVPEGTVVFAGEPLLRVTGPLMQAQIVETYLITTLTVQTLIASKAARVVAAAQGRPVFDFGSRRAHGPQAGLLAARAAYIAGCSGTSNTEAGRLLGIPTLGTQAHAWIMAFQDEQEAFRKFGQLFPDNSTLLIDTYDTVQGAHNALASGAAMQAVRLDSGDLVQLSKEVRAVLDDAGRQDVKIVASGDLNEHRIRDLLAARAPIDVFGVGTELVTSRDEPTLNVVYKLVEQQTPEGTFGRFKLSLGKKNYPYPKQVHRRQDAGGTFRGDRIVKATSPEEGEPLLAPVLRRGEPAVALPTLAENRRRCAEQLSRLPAELLALETCHTYPVQVSEELEAELKFDG